MLQKFFYFFYNIHTVSRFIFFNFSSLTILVISTPFKKYFLARPPKHKALNKFEAVCMSPDYQYQCVSCTNDLNFNLFISQDYGNTWNGYNTPQPCIYLTISDKFVYGVCKNNIIYSFSI